PRPRARGKRQRGPHGQLGDGGADGDLRPRARLPRRPSLGRAFSRQDHGRKHHDARSGRRSEMTVAAAGSSKPSEAAEIRRPKRISDVGLQVICMAALLLVLVVISRVVNSNFLSAYNLQTMGRDIAILSLFAIGQGIV